jgi:hypothetical protein
VHGKRREELGQLEGKAYKHTGVSFWPDPNVTDDRAQDRMDRAAGRRGRGATHGATRARGTVRASVKLG